MQAHHTHLMVSPRMPCTPLWVCAPSSGFPIQANTIIHVKCNCAGSPQTNSHTPWSAHGQHALPYSVHTTASFPIQASTTINIMHNNRVPQRPQDILVNSTAGDKSLAVNDALSKLWSHCHSFELARNVFYRWTLKLARNIFSRWNSQTGKVFLRQNSL